MKEIKGKLLRQTLRDKLINPEYVYLMRTEMGFQHLLSEIWRDRKRQRSHALRLCHIEARPNELTFLLRAELLD